MAILRFLRRNASPTFAADEIVVQDMIIIKGNYGVYALLLRIADPKGNKVKGKLKGSRNLRPKLKGLLSDDFKRLLEEILGGKKREKKVEKVGKAKKKVKRKSRSIVIGHLEKAVLLIED